MVRIHRDVADSGRDSVRAPRRADHEARGHTEAPREARPPGRLSEIPPSRRGSPGGSPDRRSHLRGIGFARSERRMGDPEEGPRGDEAGHLGPAAAHDPGGHPHVCSDPGGPEGGEVKLGRPSLSDQREGGGVRLFSRRLSDVTDSLPEIVAIAKSLPASEFLLEGEVVAVNADGKPLPFQDLMRRFRRVHGIAAAQEEIPLKLYLFDLLHVDGQTLVDAPYRSRWESLEGLVPSE